jgi:acetate kinase
MEWAGVQLCAERNRGVKGETGLHQDGSRVQIWTIPTNEEIVVARQTAAAIASR